jgi:hypothetical protein
MPHDSSTGLQYGLESDPTTYVWCCSMPGVGIGKAESMMSTLYIQGGGIRVDKQDGVEGTRIIRW